MDKIYWGNVIVAEKRDSGTFWVMVSSEGLLFNPSNDNINAIDKYRGSKQFKLRRCGASCYNHYIAFIKSRTVVSWKLAQRSYENEQ